ncbi:MAG: acetyl-CoA carboxylase carboxyl transferase subunit alpha, partial [Pseudomonadota bacterium]
MQNYLDFEKGLAEIEGKAEELRALGRQNKAMDVEAEAAALDQKAEAMLRELYANLTPWQKCLVARHPDR